jgi:hypothetical protein
MKRRGILAVMTTAVIGLAVPAFAFIGVLSTGATGSAATDALSAPTVVSTTAQTASSITLKVTTGPTSGPAPTSYRVDRTVGTTPSPATNVCTIAAVGNTCDDTGLSASTSYSYVIRGLIGNNWVGAASTTIATATTAAGANKLVFTTVPAGNQTATATATIGAYQVQRQTSGGSPVTTGGAISVTLSSNSAGTKFFHASSGGAVGTAITTIAIASGQSTSANFFYADTKAGSPTLTAHEASITNDGTASPTIVAAAVNKLAFSTTPSGNQTATATATIGAYQIQRQDTFGNPVSIGTSLITVNLTSDSTGTKFFHLTSGGAVGGAVTTVAIAANASTSGNFFYADTKAGTPTLTAHLAAIANDGTTSPTVVGAAATQIAFTDCSKNGGSVTAGVCASTAVGNTGFMNGFVSVLDTFGNPATVAPATSWTVALSSNNTHFVVSNSPVVITGPASESSSSFQVDYNSTGNDSSTITAHVTVGTAFANVTMTVLK